jgi:hypothetical protein
LSADTIKSRENVAFLRLLGVYTEGSYFLSECINLAS